MLCFIVALGVAPGVATGAGGGAGPMHWMQSASSCADIADKEKMDCGFPAGGSQASCEAASCCWDPKTPGSKTPWCFHKSGPTPPPPTPDPKCEVDDDKKADCGQVGSDEGRCTAANCCWQPAGAGSSTPWCYYKRGEGPKPFECAPLILNASDPGFDAEFAKTMLEKFEANLNIDGSGAVVAAPDHSTPGGSYYFHWMRDAALSTKAYMEVQGLDYSKIQTVMSAYEGWVRKVQGKQDPNQIDVRIEPKFTIPDGNPYTGGWCRPQTDGPALRAHSLTIWATVLASQGQKQYMAEKVLPLIKNDLEWVMASGESAAGCDLWEEVNSGDFLWNRMAMVQALNSATGLCQQELKWGQELSGCSADQVAQWRQKARELTAAIEAAHWLSEEDGSGYLTGSSTRPIDGSVLHAVATFTRGADGVGWATPSSKQAAETIAKYNYVFCKEYPVNNADTEAGTPGILYGRYPGDHYAGGNPWQLLTAGLAEVFYLAALEVVEKASLNDVPQLDAPIEQTLPDFAANAWRRALGSPNDVRLVSARDFTTAMQAAGDSVLARIYAHVKADGGRIDEQMDKHSGEQVSAKGLTWSYANILHAMHARSLSREAFAKFVFSAEHETMIVT